MDFLRIRKNTVKFEYPIQYNKDWNFAGLRLVRVLYGEFEYPIQYNKDWNKKPRRVTGRISHRLNTQSNTTRIETRHR